MLRGCSPKRLRRLLKYSVLRVSKPLGIFAHCDDVDIFEARTGSRETDRWSNIGVEIEMAAKVNVDR